MQIYLFWNFLKILSRIHFAKLIGGSHNVFSVDVLMNLCVLKCVLNG